MNLYYAVATIKETDETEILLEWYYSEHDFGGVELVDNKPENDWHTTMKVSKWYKNLKKYYPNAVVVKL